jgi:hypothetical protein
MLATTLEYMENLPHSVCPVLPVPSCVGESKQDDEVAVQTSSRRGHSPEYPMQVQPSAIDKLG